MTNKHIFFFSIVFAVILSSLIIGCGGDDDNELETKSELDILYEELVGTYDLFRAEVTFVGQEKQVLEPPTATGTMTISSDQRLVQNLVVNDIAISVSGTFEIRPDEGIMLIDNEESDLISKPTYTWDGEILTTLLDAGTFVEKDFWRKK
ncbi:MAG: hypothetical protein OXD54_08050 [Candidatus Poribacteria bacterium]|nr:hypothetical protein [Candidatus Poribacteria bacterium]